ncbi:hypothetical protein [Nonomuraea sp. NPDC049309]|uniref:hypothetical protein n=1 Tax=Nonomuraea sp. NPDC049309 TaxID=3364350 RepID=UPI0037206AE2
MTTVWRIRVPIGSYVPVLGLPSPHFLPQHAAMFGAGCVAWRRGWYTSLPARAGRIGLIAAAVSTATVLPASLMTAGVVSAALTALWETAFAISMIRHAGAARALPRPARFTVHIVHPLVPAGLGYALRPLEAIAIVKFAIMLVLAPPPCWGRPTWCARRRAPSGC